MAGSVGRVRVGLPSARKVTLRDGTSILVRPILPEDRDRLRAGFARLSQLSRYQRFLSSMDSLSDQQLRYFTEIDYVNHMAWGALDPSQPDQPGLGVARYIRLPDDPTTAEAAVTVIDDYQGRGIGTILLELLAISARQRGIERFRGYVSAENIRMVEILRGLGATVVREGSLLCVDVPIPTTPRELPDTPTGRVFRLVAKGALSPFQRRDPGACDQEASTLLPDRAEPPRYSGA